VTLHHVGYIDLPRHATPGRFDPTAVHRRSRRVYVAHTANDAIDVIDGFTHRLYVAIEEPWIDRGLRVIAQS